MYSIILSPWLSGNTAAVSSPMKETVKLLLFSWSEVAWFLHQDCQTASWDSPSPIPSAAYHLKHPHLHQLQYQHQGQCSQQSHHQRLAPVSVSLLPLKKLPLPHFHGQRLCQNTCPNCCFGGCLLCFSWICFSSWDDEACILIVVGTLLSPQRQDKHSCAFYDTACNRDCFKSMKRLVTLIQNIRKFI